MKTSPTGIRFEIEDLEFIKKREGLKTPQQVINFLCTEYMKLYKVEKPSIFSVEQPKVFDAPKLPSNYFEDEQLKYQKPKTILRSAEEWQSLKRECSSIEEWNEIKQQLMDAENLSSKQKQIIINTP